MNTVKMNFDFSTIDSPHSYSSYNTFKAHRPHSNIEPDYRNKANSYTMEN